MKPSERRHAAKMHYLARGRADALVAISARLGWSDKRTEDTWRMLLALERADVNAARERQNAYAS